MAALVAILAVAHREGRAQVVAETPDGPVEFIGLKRWTVQMIRDTMAVKAPGQPLGHCAAVLRSLGFPAASAAAIVMNGQQSSVVTLVEPGDSARVTYRREIADTLGDLREWRRTLRAIRGSGIAVQVAIETYPAYRAGDTVAMRRELRRVRRMEPRVKRIWRFMARHRGEADLRNALWVVANDGNFANQIAAITTLSNFVDRDSVWTTLMDLQRSRHDGVAIAASKVLDTSSRTSPRRVDWAPAVPAIRSILQGTNVYLYPGTLDILRATQVSRDLAPALLTPGAKELLMAHLAAQHPVPRQSAHAFLVYLAGRDLGSDPAAWARWMDSVH